MLCSKVRVKVIRAKKVKFEKALKDCMNKVDTMKKAMEKLTDAQKTGKFYYVRMQ